MRHSLVRGMRDILPPASARWREVEETILDVLVGHGYQEIRLPLIEGTELFQRGVGEATDLVEKEMYSLKDRKGKDLSLRPEGTAGCVRACIDGGLLRGRTPRLWYHGSMFRYERPQKGRSREFSQIGAEAFGLPGPELDFELVAMLARAFAELGLGPFLRLEINSIGSARDRERYRAALVDYLTPLVDELDGDSRRRLDTNPLRILDSKAESTRAALADAPRLEDFLSETGVAHFAAVRGMLDDAGIEYRVNRRLVRGLDYYNDTVFEWVTDELGAQAQVCGGGRYDGLVALLGGPATPAAGFGIGLDRVVLLHERCVARDYAEVDVQCVVVGEEHLTRALAVADELRRRTGLRVLAPATGAGVASQLRRADRSGAGWAVIVGGDEIESGRVSLKWLRERKEQQALTVDEAVSMLGADSGGS
ncbi:MAG: histidine--tRNA ligase [Gammaproteobacteria bacterium]|nr:histidine--tRNA ligase [Gammaproteobacteria bacterium]MYB37996.1 histidine--tRNA ligase [Gammaproteobacteria bacterium]